MSVMKNSYLTSKHTQQPPQSSPPQKIKIITKVCTRKKKVGNIHKISLFLVLCIACNKINGTLIVITVDIHSFIKQQWTTEHFSLYFSQYVDECSILQSLKLFIGKVKNCHSLL